MFPFAIEEKAVGQRISQMSDAQYLRMMRYLVIRDAELSSKYFHQLQTLSESVSDRPSMAIREHRHFRIDPPGTRYSVAIGVVQIDVDGDETKVKIKDDKKVTIETPIASEPVALADANTSEPPKVVH